MGIGKVIYFGQTLIDITSDSVSPESLLNGYTAHSANGDKIVGTLFSDTPPTITIGGVIQDSRGFNIQDSSGDNIYGNVLYKR